MSRRGREPTRTRGRRRARRWYTQCGGRGDCADLGDPTGLIRGVKTFPMCCSQCYDYYDLACRCGGARRARGVPAGIVGDPPTLGRRPNILQPCAFRSSPGDTPERVATRDMPAGCSDRRRCQAAAIGDHPPLAANQITFAPGIPSPPVFVGHSLIAETLFASGPPSSSRSSAARSPDGCLGAYGVPRRPAL